MQYKVTLKRGLPFQDGGELVRDTTKLIRIGDRSPSVHFVGRTYILPRKGPNSIPLISYGINRIYLSLYRIGDRALPPVVAVHCVNDFVQNPGGDTCLSDIVSTFGRKVWPSGQANSESYVLFAKTGLEDEATGENGDFARQWFVVTDIGLTSISGPDGLHVYARSLATAEKLPNVEVRLIALDNEILATRQTDENGAATFERPLLNGTGGALPVLVVASDEANKDYSFLDLNQTSFDLTDRGIEGREAPKDYDGYIDLERGVYRPGENVSAIVLLRDADGNAVPNIPLSMSVLRPDRTEYQGSKGNRKTPALAAT